ncbi:elongation factor G-binding protein [Halobacillus fulvus]|nr:elongation factor G-binding protein [Halobacillus fulvus]
MDPFIRSDQYHFIQHQTEAVLNSYLTTNDHAVTSAIQSIVQEKVVDAFHHLNEEQLQMVQQVNQVKDEEDAIFFLSRIKQYVFGFPELTESEVKALFPKVKKMRVPNLKNMDWTNLSYLGWNEPGAQKKYLVVKDSDQLIGLFGEFIPSRRPGMCTICREYEDVGTFTTTKKSQEGNEVISRGNYICQNSETCNQNIKSLKHLNHFISRQRHANR